MKHLRLMLVPVLVLALSGCAALGSITNPITTNRLAAIESGYGIALPPSSPATASP